jgi:hypothetical protein
MIKRSTIGLYVILLAVALVLTAAPARAQDAPRSLNDAATGENFHIIEVSTGIWSPTADMSISSESLGIPGTTIDFKRDLGLTDQRLGELHAVLRPARKQKFYFQYIPISYNQEHVLTTTIVFNGQAYTVGVPVNSTLVWNAYRFGYEYDFISRSRGFGGFLLEAKYTDVQATLARPGDTEFAHAQAPIPAVGGIVRVYVVPNISITAELSGVKIPDSVSPQYRAHYVDFDMYGTLNFTNNIGVQLGYRTFDVGYLIKQDSGSFVLQGFYFGVVGRF